MILFSKRLKELRRKAGLTQAQLGKLVGVTKVSICCYENGTRTPTLETIIDIANCLQVDLAYLLGSDGFIVSDNDNHYGINISKEEINMLKELRIHPKLYEKMLKDTKRTMDFLDKVIR